MGLLLAAPALTGCAKDAAPIEAEATATPPTGGPTGGWGSLKCSASITPFEMNYEVTGSTLTMDDPETGVVQRLDRMESSAPGSLPAIGTWTSGSERTDVSADGWMWIELRVVIESHRISAEGNCKAYVRNKERAALTARVSVPAEITETTLASLGSDAEDLETSYRY